MTKSQLVPFWALFSLSRGLNITKSDYTTDGIPCISYGDVHGRYRGFVDASTDPLPKVPESFFKSDSKSLLKDGDFVFADTSEGYDGAGDCTCILNSGVNLFAGYHITIARPRHPEQIDKDYFGFYFQTDHFKNQVRLQVNGVKVFSVTNKILNATRLYVSDIENQKNIGSKLKRKVKQIDEALSCLNELREKQEKLSQSLITHAVTKGLNPDVRMKDSGITWLGEIPAHWQVTSLGKICENIRDGTHFSPKVQSDGYAYITAEDIHGEGLNLDKAKKISKEDFLRLVRDNCKPSKGDVLLVKDGATTGRTGLMVEDLDCVTLSSVAMLTPKKGVVRSRYLRYMLDSSLLQHQIKMTMFGSAMPRTTLTRLNRYLVLLPPLDEQQAIETFCFHKVEAISKAYRGIQNEIEKLHEYRSSVISAAVHEELP